MYPEKYPEMNEFLSNVCGFDSVDDESKGERTPHNSQYSVTIIVS